MANMDDLIVRVRFEMEQSKAKFDAQINELKKKATSLQQKINSIRFDKRLAPQTRQLRMQPLQKELAGVRIEMSRVGESFKSNIIPMQGELSTLKKKVADVRKPFAGWAMSIMFAGMALQRYSMALYKFGTKAFQEISRSIEGTVTNTDILEGSMKYLGFTVGEALEPMLAYLIPVVDKISEWVERNPELVASMTTLGIVLGTAAMFLGMGKLALAGLLEGFTKLTPLIAGVKGILVGIASALGVGITAAIAIVLLAIASLVAMWTTNFAGMRDFVKETFGIIWETIKSIMNDIWSIIKDVWGLVTAILSGDWDEAWERIKSITVKAVGLLLKVIAGLGAAILNIFKFTWNFSLSTFQLFIDGILWGLQKIAKAKDDVFGGNLEGKIQGVRNSITGFFDKIKFEYTTREQVTDAFGGIDKMLGLDVKETKKEETVVDNRVNNWYNPIFQIETEGAFYDIINGASR